ncbi:MAG: helix-turn-helix transcriptional regulator [Oscillospiraceae bacterium]|nr:helix-turn-helix transcriptional regulator [Oscillospiraceae bacterium]
MLSFARLENLLEQKELNKYFLRKNGINSTQLDKMLKTGDCGGKTINKICQLLNCQPSDIMEYVPDDETDS